MRIRVILGSMIFAGLVAVTAPIAGASAAPPQPTDGVGYLSVRDANAAMAWGYVRNQATGRCLEETPGRNIGTAPCRYDNDQTWEWRAGTGSIYNWTLVNRSTGNCLDSNSNLEVYAHPCNGGNNQNWLRFDNGMIRSAPTANGMLDSNSQGEVYVHAYNGGNYQKWY